MASSVLRMRSSLCVFDATRNVKEGEEEGKALCFLPVTTPAAARGNVVGLAMGLLTFSRVFSPTRPVEAMHASGHRVIFHECEKDVWAVLVRCQPGPNDPPLCSDGAFGLTALRPRLASPTSDRRQPRRRSEQPQVGYKFLQRNDHGAGGVLGTTTRTRSGRESGFIDLSTYLQAEAGLGRSLVRAGPLARVLALIGFAGGGGWMGMGRCSPRRWPRRQRCAMPRCKWCCRRRTSSFGCCMAPSAPASPSRRCVFALLLRTTTVCAMAVCTHLSLLLMTSDDGGRPATHAGRRRS